MLEIINRLRLVLFYLSRGTAGHYVTYEACFSGRFGTTVSEKQMKDDSIGDGNCNGGFLENGRHDKEKH